MRTLKDFLEVYEPKAPDEKKFKDKHVTIKFKDRNEVGGKENGDDVFNASNVKTVARKDNRQGYNVGEDEKVYEEVDIDEARMLDTNYKAASEKSKFDAGHRAKLLNPEGRVSYLSQKSYKTAKHAKDAAKFYHSVAHLPMQTIDNKMSHYNKAYDAKHMHEEVDIDLMDENELLEFALDLIEKTLTPAEKKKREEIAKAIERGNPDMPMAQKMAIATAQAKKVAEEVEQIDETAKIVAHLQKRYGDNIRKSHVVSAANDFGVDASKLAKAVRTKLGKNMLDEEDDGWYTHSQMHGSKKSEKHPKGISAAEWKSGIRWHHGKNKRINIKEEVDQIDELSDTYSAPARVPQKMIKPEAARRMASTANRKNMSDKDVETVLFNQGHGRKSLKLINQLRKEEVEDLDEGLMHNRFERNHGRKARGIGGWAFTTKEYGSPKENEMHFTSGQKTLSDAHKEAAVKLGTKNLYVMEDTEVPFEGPYSKPGPSKDQYGNTIKNRPRYLARKAMKALTKEDIIDRAVSKYVPEELKYTPEERMIRRLEGLREDHIDVLMGLFESLNDVNQSKMIESAETEEGRNQLLDFSINNRGA